MNDYAFWNFDHVYVISHPVTGRREAMERRLLDLGIAATFVYAEQPARGFSMNNMRRNPRLEFACSLSHIKAIIRALHDGALMPLFLEDDVEFGEFGHLTEALEELPAGRWSVLYLGGHPCEDVERVGEHLVRVGRFSFAEAYSLNRAAIPALLNWWCDRIGYPDAMFDRVLGEFAADSGSGYCVVPTVTHQPAGYSYVAEKDDDKARCRESGWQHHLTA